MYSTSNQKLSVVQLLLWLVTLIPAPSIIQAFNVPAFNACIKVWITYIHLSFLPVSSATCGHSTAATVSQCWTSTHPPEWYASLGQGDTGSRWGPHQYNMLWQSPGELVHSSVVMYCPQLEAFHCTLLNHHTLLTLPHYETHDIC